MDLLEREVVLNQLNSALGETAHGVGRVTLISGEAGIGKTALVREFTRAHHGTLGVLWGSCDALFSPRPLGPLHDIANQTEGMLSDLLEHSAERTAIFGATL